MKKIRMIIVTTGLSMMAVVIVLGMLSAAPAQAAPIQPFHVPGDCMVLIPTGVITDPGLFSFTDPFPLYTWTDAPTAGNDLGGTCAASNPQAGPAETVTGL
ncbi:MAG: hypothetical protein GY869_10800 [Planctomycetes bacterium]|nr:hypothetical protein [Planctomycetota bacterium]